MRKCIVYKYEEGLAIVHPAPNETHTIEEIAEKDVPSGLPYKIIDFSEIPTDRTFRDAWDIDEKLLTDGVGGEHSMFLDDPQHPDYKEPETEGKIE